jgi:hypothetical protein
MNPNNFGSLLAQAFGKVLIGFVSLVASTYFLLVVCDSAVKAVRYAFGVELPDPIDWMPLFLRPW